MSPSGFASGDGDMWQKVCRKGCVESAWVIRINVPELGGVSRAGEDGSVVRERVFAIQSWGVQTPSAHVKPRHGSQG